MAFQGIPGSFSSVAARAFFGAALTPIHTERFRDIFEAVSSGEALHGVIPIENSLAGSIHENYDLLAEYPLCITGELHCPVDLHLLGRGQLRDIQRIFSHPKALEQCSSFLREHPHWVQEGWADTASAAQHVATCGDDTYAAVASEECSSLYDLPIVKHSIQNHARNITRFLVIGCHQATDAALTKCSLIVTLTDGVSSLHTLLHAAAQKCMTLTKVEARPLAQQPFAYRVHLDFTGPAITLESWRAKLSVLEQYTREFRIVGLYQGAIW